MAQSGLEFWRRFVIGFWRKLLDLKVLGAFRKYCRLHSSIFSLEHADTVSDATGQMDLALIQRKLTRLVSKLRKHCNVSLELFHASDLHFGELLGKGGEAEVYKCTLKYKNILVEAAAKIVMNNADDSVRIALDEIENLCLAQDPIVPTTQKVYGVAVVPSMDNPLCGNLVILTEIGLMNALELYQQENIPLMVTFDFWKRLAMSHYIMHHRHILHQDIKPENILITAISRDKHGHIENIDFRIIDLGMAKQLYTKKVITDDILGTDGYHPPEVLDEDCYDFRADIFMLGITFCVLLHSPQFLKSKSTLDSFLKNLHVAKRRQYTGHALFEKVIASTIEELQNIPPSVIGMICAMLETQKDRKITLLDVVQTCSSAFEEMKKQSRRKSGRPLKQKQNNVNNCGDSGFGSTGECSKRRHVAKRKRSDSPVSCAVVSESTPCEVNQNQAKQSKSKRLKKTLVTQQQWLKRLHHARLEKRRLLRKPAR